MNNFSLTIAQDLFDNTNPFPVDFDIAWEWLDYDKKGNAKTALLAAGFTIDIDFLINQELGSLAVPRPAEKIFLTVDCLKMWAMMAGTTKGKEVRCYFLECEKIAKARVIAPAAPVAPIETKLMVSTEIKELQASFLPASVKQLLIDSLINEYITDAPKLTASLERWVGVAQKAEELGYKVNSSSRVKLGHYAASQSDRLVCQREERLCNGMMRKIWVYLDNSNLTQIIEEFYQIAAD
jgi:phage anti-repressor protein